MYLSGFDYLTHPFVGMCLAILVTAGFVQCGRWFANRLCGEADAVFQAAGFIFIIGLCGTLIHSAALFGLLRLWWLRGFGSLLALIGVWQIVTWRPDVSLLKNQYSRANWLEKVIWCVVGTILVALLFAALAPATDGDSLYYHLGVPVDWLNHGGAVARPYWFHAHLIGLGEMINLLGLAMGASNLGAVVQYASLWVILVGLLTEVRKEQRLLTVLMVVGTPVMLFLIPNQKPQMLPTAAITIALILLVRSSLTATTTPMLVLAFGSVAVAIGCKYTGLVTGGIVILFGLWQAHKRQALWQAVGIAAGLTLLFAGTIWLRNLWFYGDPLSPFLHDILTPDVLRRGAFADYLREYNMEPLWQQLLMFIVPFDPGMITAVLGVGVLGIFLVRRGEIAFGRTYITITFISAIALFLTSQLTPRFFIEPYIWSAIAIGASSRLRWRKLFITVLTMQAVGVAVFALFAAVTLFPGSLTPTLFDETMTRTVEGYLLHDWMDEMLPDDAVVFADMRLGMVYPRPFLSVDIARYWDKLHMHPKQLFELFLIEFEEAKAVRGVTHLIVEKEGIDIGAWSALPCVGESIAEGTFESGGGRNPFGREPRTMHLVILPIAC